MGGPPKHSILIGCFICIINQYKPSIFGVPSFKENPIGGIAQQLGPQNFTDAEAVSWPSWASLRQSNAVEHFPFGMWFHGFCHELL